MGNESTKNQIAPARSPLVELTTIAAPVAATMLSYTLAQFVDFLMISQLGPEAQAAQGNGSIISFVALSAILGVFVVINTYVSQHVGAGNPKRAPAYAWNGLWMALFAWVFILIPFAIFSQPINAAIGSLANTLNTHSQSNNQAAFTPEILKTQAAYAQILLFGGIFTISSRAMSHFYFGIHKPVIIFIATVAGNAVNLIANYGLIFGNFGLPALGVPGAAIGTVIGSAVEFAIPMALFLAPAIHNKYATRTTWRPSAKHIRDIFRIGWPSALMFGNEIICWAILFAVILGGISVADNAASWIALRFMQLSFMPAVGISIAVTALVGKYIGMGRHDLAEHRAWLGLKVTMLYMGACALIMVLFRNQLVSIFINTGDDAELAAEVLRIGSTLMICAALFQIFDAVGINMVGALRGAGDTVWPGVATVILSWTLLVGGGFAMARYQPELRSLGPWIAAAIYIIVFAAAMLARFLTGKWRSLKIIDRPTTTPEADAATLPAIASPGAPSLTDFETEAASLASSIPSPPDGSD